MAFGELIKNKNFIVGLVAGLILTFGSSYIPVIGDLTEFIFDSINNISPLSALGVFGNIIHSYLLTLFIYLILTFLINKKLLFSNLFIFSFGFLASFILFLLLALLAISQFRFTQ